MGIYIGLAFLRFAACQWLSPTSWDPIGATIPVFGMAWIHRRWRGERMTADTTAAHLNPRYRVALLVSALLNALMFFAEGAVGWWIGSAALLADAVDFLEDTGIYALAAIAVAWSARQRAFAGLAMGLAMIIVGLVALWQVTVRLLWGGAPAFAPMAATAAAALAVNVFCAWRLVPHRRGDASMRSVWISTRNDAVLNALTIIAAGGVGITTHAWPDIAAGLIIAGVNLWAAREILHDAREEIAAS
jgi:Co/Zn/Cd efflux system component